ncbi:MAG: hypothetical protein FD121_542 [Gallionellaceae bacterium]|nr:MAG: hypothetical protein FD121_542 [Gallionellaceae bacterium]
MKTLAIASERKQAQNPHNLFVAGVFAFDLLMTPAVLGLKIGMIGLLIPLVCSGGLLAYIYTRSCKETSWFVDMHWRLTWKRSRLLLLGYSISAFLVLVAWLLSTISGDPHMASIVWTALTRVALMPTLIFVLFTSVLEASSIAQAANGEVPDKLAVKYPPPAGLIP